MASKAVQRCLLGFLQRLVDLPLRACFQQVVQHCFLGKVGQGSQKGAGALMGEKVFGSSMERHNLQLKCRKT